MMGTSERETEREDGADLGLGFVPTLSEPGAREEVVDESRGDMRQIHIH
jgi:hypothetical protein